MNVGIMGGGQLARMLALAGYPLGLSFRVLDPAADACAGVLCPQIVADFDDPAALAELADWADVVTFDFENVPEDSARALGEMTSVRPGAQALAAAQDRLREKTLFADLDIPCAPHAAVDNRDEFARALAQLGTPAILKTRRLGYDGKGQFRVDSESQLDEVWQATAGSDLILEGCVDFQREVSQIAVRSGNGEMRFYPLTENVHRQGILHTSRVPAHSRRDEDARRHTRALAEALDYVGVIAVEFFETEEGLVANEFAPRVHNSGHWTADGAQCSQFENHLRAVCDLPLGGVSARGPSAMVNLIGQVPAAGEILTVPGAHLHDYGKAARAGRKVGHVNLCSADEASLDEAMRVVSNAVVTE